MARRQHNEHGAKDTGKKERPAPQPVDVHGGIPDRVACPSRKRGLIVAGIYVAWAMLLVYCLLAG